MEVTPLSMPFPSVVNQNSRRWLKMAATAPSAENMAPITNVGPYRGDSTKDTGRGFMAELMTDPAMLLKMVPMVTLG